MYARLAAQERADQRKEQVLRQTRDSQLAQQAAALEFRREMGMRQNARQTQQLRLREQQAEQKTAGAARQLLGMRKLQEDIGNGMPLEQALAKNSSELFSDHPERLASAMRASREAKELGPEAYTARDILDAQGQPTGMSAIPGRGAARVLTQARERLSPEGRMRGLTTQLGILKGQLEEAKKADRPAIQQKIDSKLGELDDLMKGKTIERVSGKEDERTDTGEEGEGDFGLPPVDMGEEEENPEGDEEEMSDEYADEEPAPDEEDTELAEDF